MAQQTRIVSDLAPAAIDAVNAIIEEQERPMHNRGPAETEKLEAIAMLVEFDVELGTVLASAQTRSPLEQQLAIVKSNSKTLVRWTVKPYGLVVPPLPPR